jgi:hypothetical protein
MKRVSTKDMTVEQLVERFTTMALDQDEALLMDELARYNRIYDQMDALKKELKVREGDKRRVLLPLLDHGNAQVRLKAAIATLTIEPEAAREALQKIVDQKEFPQAGSAGSMLDALDEGRYVPS